jgi:hydrogenase-1 operon protein HyaF
MNDSLNRKLQAIRVSTEVASGNIAPLLHEVRHALAALVQTGTPGIIDLSGIPLAPGEQEKILALLGDGEVRAELLTLGRSTICETGYPGVWIVTHYDEEGNFKTRFIEITTFPAILASQDIDVAEGLQRLEATLHAKQ